MAAPRIDCLVVVGVGLIGGSFARALRRRGVVGHVIGVSRTAATLQRALDLGVIDEIASDQCAVLQRADVVLLATPVGALGGWFERLAEHLRAGAVVTDVGSVKGDVVAVARAALGPALPRFVPGHPIAGTENAGVEASFAELFENRHVVLTPQPETDADALRVVEALWQECGADVVTMAADRHDDLLALTSHMPHVVAYALVDSLAGHPDADQLFELAAGGFYDFTRIASSDPTMWRDICLSNRRSLTIAINRFQERLAELLRAIENKDGSALYACFERSKSARDVGLEKKGQGRGRR